jgi:DNA-binding NarL/FixJ family response regulator
MPITVVIVEDLDEVREGLAQYLNTDSSFSVVDTFKTAEQAIWELPKLQPDIVIMDINLPGLTGIECISQLRSKLGKTQFMMFTVYENDEKVFEALRAGASGYLLKNTSLAQLSDSLRELHSGGSPMSANIARKLVRLLQKQPAVAADLNNLTARENEILTLLSKGQLYKEIADALKISVSTVRQHIHNIYEKLHVQNRTEALNKAFGRH